MKHLLLTTSAAVLLVECATKEWQQIEIRQNEKEDSARYGTLTSQVL
jgi:hypothetical protein